MIFRLTLNIHILPTLPTAGCKLLYEDISKIGDSYLNAEDTLFPCLEPCILGSVAIL